MEVILKIISVLLFFILLLVPVLILKFQIKPNTKFKLIKYLLKGIFISFFLSLVFSWWNDKTNEILLHYYDAFVYDPDVNEYKISYDKVLSDNLDKVKILEVSYMGIGWTLKSIFVFIIYFPYLLIIYLIYHLINLDRNKKVSKITTY